MPVQSQPNCSDDWMMRKVEGGTGGRRRRRKISQQASPKWRQHPPRKRRPGSVSVAKVEAMCTAVRVVARAGAWRGHVRKRARTDVNLVGERRRRHAIVPRMFILKTTEHTSPVSMRRANRVEE